MSGLFSQHLCEIYPDTVYSCHLFFHCLVVLHYMNMPQFIYPFYYSWTFVLFPVDGYHEYSCYGDFCKCHFLVYVSAYIGVELLGYRVYRYSALLGAAKRHCINLPPSPCAVCLNSCCSAFLPTLGNVRSSNYDSRSATCAMLPCFSF